MSSLLALVLLLAGGQTAAPAAGATDPEALRALRSFARCVVGNSADKAGRTLALDFRSHDYDAGLKTLARVNEGCFRRRGMRMQASGLLAAGAMAEELLARDAEPLNIRLARAAAGPATTAFSGTDRAAICAVRSSPDEAAALFATEIASDAEAAALRPLQGVYGRCLGPDASVTASRPGLRAMLATAAFRTVRAATREIE